MDKHLNLRTGSKYLTIVLGQSCCLAIPFLGRFQTLFRTDLIDIVTLFRVERPKTIPYTAARPRIGLLQRDWNAAHIYSFWNKRRILRLKNTWCV